jgi:hypothetical protein
VTEKAPDALVAMRLVNMRKVHPAQDNSRVCSRCGSRVGIYPSGQRALRQYPGLPVICLQCSVKGAPPDEVAPAASAAEVVQEARESVPARGGVTDE